MKAEWRTTWEKKGTRKMGKGREQSRMNELGASIFIRIKDTTVKPIIKYTNSEHLSKENIKFLKSVFIVQSKIFSNDILIHACHLP